MPFFEIELSGKREQVEVSKRVTSIGRSPGNDLVIDCDEVEQVHAQVVHDGEAFVLSTIGKAEPFLVNGRRRSEARLSAGDVVSVGKAVLTFRKGRPVAADREELRESQIAAYSKLLGFSEKLSERYDLPKLFNTLLDLVIEVSKADKGFLILLDDGRPLVLAARNLKRGNIGDAVEQLSDSIVENVLRTREAIIVSDALSDPQFQSSVSVVNLKLLSVMCVPLLSRGNMLGLIYVGNDRAANIFDNRSLDVLRIFASQASLIVQDALLVNELRLDKEGLLAQIENMRFGELIGTCDSMLDVFETIRKVAGVDVSVLIQGETGTGKELVAREIHRRSARSSGPFVAINCGSIPDGLLESELFGHVRGAFTGAIATVPGKFRAASGGTIFLDEIAEMSPALQVKLLRVLEEKVVTRVGDVRPEAVDVRIIAASNKNLEERASNGRFRSDLYYRINTITIELPPLRERGDDIVLIANYILNKCSAEFGSRVKGFTPEALVTLKKYSWPGNVRQLENKIKRAAIMASAPLITPAELEIEPEMLEPTVPLAGAKEQFQQRYIDEILRRNNWNRTKTARDLDVDPRTIFRHIEKHHKKVKLDDETGGNEKEEVT